MSKSTRYFFIPLSTIKIESQNVVKLLFLIFIGIAYWSPGYNSVFPQQVRGPYILLEALPDPSREINDAFSKSYLHLLC